MIVVDATLLTKDGEKRCIYSTATWLKVWSATSSELARKELSPCGVLRMYAFQHSFKLLPFLYMVTTRVAAVMNQRFPTHTEVIIDDDETHAKVVAEDGA